MNMRSQLDEPLKAWAAAAVVLIVGIASASLAFPQRVYEGIIWQYFWGPVVADAHGVSTAGCAVRDGGETSIYTSASDCAAASGIVAHPGYTTFSTISYALILIFAIVGVVLLMQRLEIGSDQSLFYALIPYVFLGGTLRVVEDANALVFRETGDMVIGLPVVGFIISPLIYFAVFILAAVALLGSIWLDDRDLVSRYEIPFASVGLLALVGSFAAIGYFYASTDTMGLFPSVAIISLGGATVIAAATWVITERYWPVVNAGTGFMGVVVVWGHAVDGIANVISLDWGEELGLARSYEPKHVVNAAIRDITGSIQPGWISEAIGTAWPFLPVKVLVAIVVVWVFNDEVFEESPNFAMLMLVAIFAVGLGPGTRDFLRVTFGI